MKRNKGILSLVSIFYATKRMLWMKNNHAENGCYFAINTPKTEAGKRDVPMLGIVKDALLQ